MKMQLKDDKTKQVFSVDPTKTREYLDTRDGVKVKVFPTVIKMTVGRNEKVDGITVLGPRRMTRIT